MDTARIIAVIAHATLIAKNNPEALLRVLEEGWLQVLKDVDLYQPTSPMQLGWVRGGGSPSAAIQARWEIVLGDRMSVGRKALALYGQEDGWEYAPTTMPSEKVWAAARAEWEADRVAYLAARDLHQVLCWVQWGRYVSEPPPQGERVAELVAAATPPAPPAPPAKPRMVLRKGEMVWVA